MCSVPPTSTVAAFVPSGLHANHAAWRPAPGAERFEPRPSAMYSCDPGPPSRPLTMNARRSGRSTGYGPPEPVGMGAAPVGGPMGVPPGPADGPPGSRLATSTNAISAASAATAAACRRAARAPACAGSGTSPSVAGRTRNGRASPTLADARSPAGARSLAGARSPAGGVGTGPWAGAAGLAGAAGSTRSSGVWHAGHGPSAERPTHSHRGHQRSARSTGSPGSTPSPRPASSDGSMRLYGTPERRVRFAGARAASGILQYRGPAAGPRQGHPIECCQQ